MNVKTPHVAIQQLPSSENATSVERILASEGPMTRQHHREQPKVTRSWHKRLWFGKRKGLLKLQPSKSKEKTSHEKPKVVVSRSKKRWLPIVLVHIVPVLAVIVIAAINLSGYFIGTQFVGVTSAASQSIALLSLQVTAKLLELAVIASLSFIILDVIHHFLLLDDHGLPLALTGIRSTFNNLFFLLSPSFWIGINALHSRRARIGVGFLLLSCGLVATLIGPTAALLLIPANKSQWYAGGLRLRIQQPSSQIWPLQLNSSHIGGPGCEYYEPIQFEWPYSPDCIWNAVDSISPSMYLSTDTEDLGYGNVTASGSGSIRDISYIDRSYTWSSMAFAVAIGAILEGLWMNFVEQHTWTSNGFGPWNNFGKYGRYSSRDQRLDFSQLKGVLSPVARANCTSNWHYFSNVSALSYPAITFHGDEFIGPYYDIKTSFIQETSIVRTWWIKPESSSTAPQVIEDNMGRVPSAFFVAQIPFNSTEIGAVVTCSIDARWVNSFMDLSYTGFGPTEGSFTWEESAHTEFNGTTFDDKGQIIDEASSSVDLDVSWLNFLTPTLNETIPGVNTTQASSGYNSFSRLLNAYDYNTNIYLPVTNRPVSARTLGSFMATKLERMLPILVVDGMARFNYFDYFGFIQQLTTIDASMLFPGGDGTDEPPNVPLKPSDTEFFWTMTIGGYAYIADNTAAVLALVLLFTYLLLALGHIAFTLYKRWNAIAWLYTPDIVAMCHNSPPSALLKNTSGGVDARATNQLLLKSRVHESASTGQDEGPVHVLINKNYRDSGYREAVSYKKVGKGRKYC